MTKLYTLSHYSGTL